MILKNSNKKNQNRWATINKGVIYIHPTLMPHGQQRHLSGLQLLSQLQVGLSWSLQAV